MKKYVIGIDNGSTVIKAGLYDLEGNEIAIEKDRVDTFSRLPGFYERDLDAIWAANVAVIKGVLLKSGVDPSQVLSLSLTGYGNGAHLVDENGNPTYNSIESSDSRGLDIVQEWIDSGSYDIVQPLNMQSLWPAMNIVMLKWLYDNDRDVIDNSKYAFSVKDYVRFKLTGEAYAEITDVSGSGIVNIKEKAVDQRIFDVLGMSDCFRLIPPLVKSTEICGAITEEVAQVTGLVEGTPVVAGCYDIDAAAIATGTVKADEANIIVGTWCNNQCISSKPIYNENFFSTTCFVEEDKYLILEGSPTSASNLEWFVNEFLQTEKERAAVTGSNVFDICNEAIRTTTPFESSVVFLPFLFGSNAGKNAKSVIVGLEGWHKRKHVIRAIYEGICFSHRHHLEKLYKHIEKPSSLKVSGGATNSDEWLHMFADVLQANLETTKGEELGTLGASILAAVGVNAYESIDEAIEHMVKKDRVVLRNTANEEIYTKKYERYKKVIVALESVWEN